MRLQIPECFEDSQCNPNIDEFDNETPTFVHLQTSLLHCLKSSPKTIGESVPIETIMSHSQPFQILFVIIFLNGSSQGLRYQQKIEDHQSCLEKLEQFEYQV